VAGQNVPVTQSGCGVTLNPNSGTAPQPGGNGSINVSAPSGCPWEASTATPWITLSGTQGTASGAAGWTVPVNNTGSTRSGTVQVSGSTYTLTQPGSCTFTLSGIPVNTTAMGTTQTVAVAAAAGCSWTASTSTSWIHISVGASGSGNGNVVLTFDPNRTGSQRSGSVTVAGQNVPVTQSGCGVTLNPNSGTAPQPGGSGSINVQATSGCPWEASTTTPWITLSGTQGTASGVAGWTAAANNSGASRTGTVLVSGSTYTLTQDGACTFNLTGTPVNTTPTGTTQTVGVTANAGCAWTSSTSTPWIHISSGANGSGNGSVVLTFDANRTGSSRPGSVTVAGQSVSVTQAGCGVTLNPNSGTAPLAGGSGSVNVSAPSGCPWEATTSTAWITLSAAQGTASGAAGWTVAANNTGASRTGTIQVSGSTYTLTQIGACNFTFSPNPVTTTAAGTSQTLSVTTSSSCSWTANAEAPWIHISSGASGQGNGNVGLTFDPNRTGQARSSSVTISGNAIAVSQSGCSVTLNPSSGSVPVSGGTGSIAVSAVSGCPWEASTTASWISLNGTQGSGTGSVGWSVGSNSGGTRTGTVIVSGATYTLTQGSPGSLSLDVSSVSVQVGSTAQFSVTVRDQSGTPVSGATVPVVDGYQLLNPSVTTGSDGRAIYSVTIPASATPGFYSMRFGPAQKAGLQPSTEVTVTLTVSVPGAPSGITVINHGFAFSGDMPDWQLDMAVEICSRLSGRARIYEYAKNVNLFRQISNSACAAVNPTESIVLFDWADDSNNPTAGYSEAAGSALFTALLRGRDYLSGGLANIHFIGHSRGAAVNSEAVKRLLKWNETARVIQSLDVTFLDPHDYGVQGSISPPIPSSWWTDFDVNVPILPSRGVAAWASNLIPSLYYENYYQTVQELAGISSISGARQVSLNSLISPCQHSFTGPLVSALGTAERIFNLPIGTVVQTIGSHLEQNACHGKVIDWYRGTIRNTAETNGYALSRIGGKQALRDAGTNQSLMTVNSYDPLSGIVNGDFEKDASPLSNELPGWGFHGGSGQALSQRENGNGFLKITGERLAKLSNLFYVPSNASKIRFDAWPMLVLANTTLEIQLNNGAVTDLRCDGERFSSGVPFTAPPTRKTCLFSIPASSRGALESLLFRVQDIALDGYRDLRIDNVRMVSDAQDSARPQITRRVPSTTPLSVSSLVLDAAEGDAQDDLVVTKVTWTNDRGGSGVATLERTTSSAVRWRFANVALQSGRNTITVTAWDDSNQSSSLSFALDAGSSTPCTTCYTGGGGSGALGLVPVTPCRVIDTRPGGGKGGAFGPPSLGTGQVREVPVPQSSCGIPSTAKAYSLNITVVPSGPLSYLSAWPTGQPRPLVSTLNSFHGGVVANAAIVPAGNGGAISLYVTNPSDVIVDINGYFDGGGLDFTPVTPCRMADTRAGEGYTGLLGPPMLTGGTTRDLPLANSRCSVPSSAQAYSLNATVVPPSALSYLNLFPTAGSPPLVSSLNSFDGAVVANAAIVPAGNGAAVSAYATNSTELILDVNGYFGGAGAGLRFYSVTPCRVSDTREVGGQLAGASSRAFAVSGRCGVPSGAQAYSMNVTAIPAGGLSYLTIWPAGQPMPVVSTLNSFQGRILANAALVPAGAGGSVSVFVTDPAHVVLDINGYFAP